MCLTRQVMVAMIVVDEGILINTQAAHSTFHPSGVPTAAVSR